jgi:hypothetical protein
LILFHSEPGQPLIVLNDASASTQLLKYYKGNCRRPGL